jgi:hypothetical protein
MKLLQRWKQSTVHNQAAILTGILVAFGTLFYAAAAACQVSIMKQASTDAAAQVERLTGATNAAIKKAVDVNSASVKDAIKQNIDSMKDILAQNRDALKASERQSKAALDASIAASRIDQRPIASPRPANGCFRPEHKVIRVAGLRCPGDRTADDSFRSGPEVVTKLSGCME